MSEPGGNPEGREAAAEHIPSREEIMDFLKQFIEGESKETRSKSDEKGLYFMEIEVAGKKPGEVTEYSYKREGQFKEVQATVTTIEAINYEDGMPVGGKTIADFKEGKWVMAR